MSVEHPANYETIIVCHFSPDDKAVFVIHSNDDWQRCGPRETAYLLGEDQSDCYPMPAIIDDRDPEYYYMLLRDFLQASVDFRKSQLG